MEQTPLQAWVDIHRGDALRILDFPHAAEHLNQLLEALTALGHVFPVRMLERCFQVLKQRGPDALVRMADRLTEREITQEAERPHVTYLRKRLPLMQYPLFRRAGWPIGSGMVESANKLVVEARLKGSGMRLRAHQRESDARLAHWHLQGALAGDVAHRKPAAPEWARPAPPPAKRTTARNQTRGSQAKRRRAAAPPAAACPTFPTRSACHDSRNLTTDRASSLET